jgi:hypothetical protein
MLKNFRGGKTIISLFSLRKQTRVCNVSDCGFVIQMNGYQSTLFDERNNEQKRCRTEPII